MSASERDWWKQEHWTCIVCGEGYPSAANAGVPENGVVILILEEDLPPLCKHLPTSAVVRTIREGGESA